MALQSIRQRRERPRGGSVVATLVGRRGPRERRCLGALTVGIVLLGVGGCTRQEQVGSALLERELPITSLADSTFARIISEFSEPDRFFDTDNLISNEGSYLDVASTLDSLSIRGGAYLGVGPDQNFSYMARIRPRIAFLIDIRRDNLLEVLWYKALFHGAKSRVEFLATLFGRPPPDDLGAWSHRPLDDLLSYIDGTQADSGYLRATRARIENYLLALDGAIDSADLETIARMHLSFAEHGLGLRFTTFGRPPRGCYPTYGELLSARDLAGRQASYLATEGDFRFVKALHDQNLVIPIVGDLAGPHALKRIGSYLEARGTRVSVFYTSNVEFYLAQDGIFGPFVENLASLPHDTASVIIRSVFSSRFGSLPPPRSQERSCSVQSLHPIATLLNHERSTGYTGYGDLVTRHSLELR